MATTTSFNGGFIGASAAYFSGGRDFGNVTGSTSSGTPYVAGGNVALAFATQLAAVFTSKSITIPATASEQAALAAIVQGILDGKNLTDVSTSLPNSYLVDAEIAAEAYAQFLVQAGGVLT
jgi:hypothetical protein